jgi:uncharacterized membrane protein
MIRMSTPPAPTDRVVELAAELGRLGRHLDELGAELLTLPRGHSGPSTEPAAPDPGPPVPVPPAYGRPYPSGWSPDAPHPHAPPSGGSQSSGPYAGPSYAHPPCPPPPRPSAAHAGPPAAAPRGASLRAWLASLSGARLLAWTGGGVTLLGVVLLLALAAARGWVGPPMRVGAGAALGVALVGLAMRLHRRETARTGALALAATGVATLYLVVAAATALYDYLPVPVGLLLALLVAALGLGLADRWRSALLACGVVIGAALLAPVVIGSATPLLVALVLVLQAAATVVALRRRWPALVAIGAAGPVVYGMLAAALTQQADWVATAAVAAVVLLLGVAGAVGAGRVESGDMLPRGLRIGLVVAAPLPALTFAAVVGGWQGAALAFAAAVLLLAAAVLPGEHVLRTVALAAGGIALFEAAAVAFDANTESAVLLGQGVVLLTVAAVLRSRRVLLVGAGFAVLGVLTVLGEQVPLSSLVDFPAAPFVLGITPQREALLAAVVLSALVVAAAVAALAASARVGLLGTGSARLWAPVGLVGLYGAAGFVIALAELVAPTRTGFVTGHALVTVSWTVLAIVLLARGIHRPALQIAGLVLVAAAVAKLLLFDLVALDGIARVAAFLGAGLLLLAAGTRYARHVAEADAPEPAPDA